MSLTGLCEVVMVARGIASGDRVAAGEGMVLSLGKSKLKRALFAFSAQCSTFDRRQKS